MTGQEWATLAERIQSRWYMVEIPPSSLDRYLADLADLEGEHVSAAIDALSRDGREFPPTAGQIRQQVNELQLDLPEWAEAWATVHRAIRRFGHYRELEALEWLDEQHAALGQFVRQAGFRDLCLSQDPPGVVEGHMRRQWEQLVAAARRDASLHGLPDAGMKRIARVNSDPKRLGQALRDALPKPEPEVKA